MQAAIGNRKDEPSFVGWASKVGTKEARLLVIGQFRVYLIDAKKGKVRNNSRTGV